MPDGPVARSGSALLGSERWVGSSYSHAVCRAPAPPSPHAPRSSLVTARSPLSSWLCRPPAEPRSCVQRGPGLWCSTRNRCRNPAGPRAPRCYLLVEAAAGDLAPHCRPTRGPFRGPHSYFCVHFLGEPGADPVPGLCPACCPGHACCPSPPLCASFLAAGTGGRAPDCRCCSASEWFSELSK